MLKSLCIALTLSFATACASAGEAAPLADDPALEARVMQIAEELRCLVCQNETIAASHADLAVDLRRQIREQLGEGRDRAQIIDYMVARYGEFVRYRPAFNAVTALLWTGPFVLLLGIALAFASRVRRRRHEPAPPPLAEADAQRAQRLLDAVPTP